MIRFVFKKAIGARASLICKAAFGASLVNGNKLVLGAKSGIGFKVWGGAKQIQLSISRIDARQIATAIMPSRICVL